MTESHRLSFSYEGHLVGYLLVAHGLLPTVGMHEYMPMRSVAHLRACRTAERDGAVTCTCVVAAQTHELVVRFESLPHVLRIEIIRPRPAGAE